MIRNLMGVGAYANSYSYGQYNQNRIDLKQASVERAKALEQAQSSSRVRSVAAVGRASDPGTPVQPVDPVIRVDNDSSGELTRVLPFLRKGADPAEMAVRMRMKQYDPERDAREVTQAMRDMTVQKRIDDKLFANSRQFTRETRESGEAVRAAQQALATHAKNTQRLENIKDDIHRSETVMENARRVSSSKPAERDSQSRPSVALNRPSADNEPIQSTARTIAQVEAAEESSTPIEKRKPFFAIA